MAQKRRKGPREAKKEGRTMIIAVDFDGILCENEFPEIGRPNYDMVSFVREMIDIGHEVILWTSRVDKELDAAVDWCGDRGLHFCAINENAPSNMSEYKSKYPNGTRKVYADIYIDDHNPMFIMWERTNGYYSATTKTIDYVRRIALWKEEN